MRDKRHRALVSSVLCGVFAATWLISLYARISVGTGSDTGTGDGRARTEWELVLSSGALAVGRSVTEPVPGAGPASLPPLEHGSAAYWLDVERIRSLAPMDSLWLPDWRWPPERGGYSKGQAGVFTWSPSLAFFVLPIWLFIALFGLLAFFHRNRVSDSASSPRVPMPRAARSCLIAAVPIALLWLLPEMWVRFHVPFMYYPSGRSPTAFDVGAYCLRRYAAPWIALILCCIAAVITRRARRETRRWADGLCRTCGYDLRASTGRCPECGTPVPPDLVRKPLNAGE